MMNVFHLLPLHLVILAINQSDCFVTQLQKCGRYHGNFSVRHTDKYFKGTVGETLKNLTRKECGLHCTLYFGCLFFNHKMDGTLCELITSYKGETIPYQPGWQIVATSLEKVHLRGPLCRYIGNACSGHNKAEYATHCEDTCEAPGFKCVKDTNIAVGKTAKASSLLSAGGVTRHARFAIDGDGDTAWSPSRGNEEWLLVDLSEQRLVAYFWWKQMDKTSQSVKKMYPKMKSLRIRIGDHDETNVNSNKVCIENVDHTKLAWLGFWCTNGPMYGRYVVLQKGTTPEDQIFYVAEIQIFALD